MFNINPERKVQALCFGWKDLAREGRCRGGCATSWRSLWSTASRDGPTTALPAAIVSSDLGDKGLQKDPRSYLRMICVDGHVLQRLISDIGPSVNGSAEKATRTLVTASGKTLPEVHSVSCLDLCFSLMR